MSAKFYICKGCGNLVQVVQQGKCTPACCGTKMEEIIAGTVEAAREKHIPVPTVDSDTIYVNVGSVDHPMLETHLIDWIYLETEKGGQLKHLAAGEAPKASFHTAGDKPVAVYAYCNLHGLWKADI